MKYLVAEIEGSMDDVLAYCTNLVSDFFEHQDPPEEAQDTIEEESHGALPMPEKPPPPPVGNGMAFAQLPTPRFRTKVPPSPSHPWKHVPAGKKSHTWENAPKSVATKTLKNCRICGLPVLKDDHYRSQVSNPAAQIHEACAPGQRAAQPEKAAPPLLAETPATTAVGGLSLFLWEKAPKRLAMMDFAECRLCDQIIKKGEQYRAPTSNTSARAHETCVQQQADMLTKLPGEGVNP